jgi:hypothetical protein
MSDQETKTNLDRIRRQRDREVKKLLEIQSQSLRRGSSEVRNRKLPRFQSGNVIEDHLEHSERLLNTLQTQKVSATKK